MFGLDTLAKLLKILNNGATPNQIAGAIALGFLLGLFPGWPLHAFALLFIIILLNVNLSMAILATGLGTAIAWLGDPLFHATGGYLLEQVDGLKPFWTTLYNSPVAMLTRFNNTVMMGSLAIGLVLLVPMFFLARMLVVQYRTRVLTHIERLKVMQLLKGSKFYNIYSSLSN